ncbi:MAG: hypothetical protein RRC34_02885 [Lentisphaeria bacterium]|nr:hypothetical protein [Lentisphaeria bacterium]
MPEITHNIEEVTNSLTRAAAVLADPMAYLTVWGQGCAIQFRKNARAKGGKSFWQDVARQTVLRTVSGEETQVWVPIAGAHKQTGGVIRPKNARALTIPVADEARGKRAGEFEQGGRELFTLDIDGDPDTIGLLGYAEEDGDFHPLFVLRTRVDQDPDEWYPDEAVINAIGVAEANRMAATAGGVFAR